MLPQDFYSPLDGSLGEVGKALVAPAHNLAEIPVVFDIRRMPTLVLTRHGGVNKCREHAELLGEGLYELLPLAP